MTPKENTEFIQDLRILRLKLQPVLEASIETGNLTSDDVRMVNAMIADHLQSAEEDQLNYNLELLASDDNPESLEGRNMQLPDHWLDTTPEERREILQNLDLEEKTFHMNRRIR